MGILHKEQPVEADEDASAPVQDVVYQGDASDVLEHLENMYEGIDTKTDITKVERNLLLRLEVIQNMEERLCSELQIPNDSPLSILQITTSFKLLSISKDRKGRQEIFDIFKPSYRESKEKKRWLR